MRSLRRWALGASLAAVCASFGHRARAAKYEVFVQVSDEEDIYDLFLDDQIGEDTFDTLIELIQRGMDINEASREQLYVLPNLTYADVDAILTFRDGRVRIDDPGELVDAGALSREKLRAITPFLDARGDGEAENEAWARMTFRRSTEEAGLPASALQGRVFTLEHLTVGGAAVGTRNRLGGVAYDPTRDALAANPPRTELVVPKLYAHWDTPEYGVIIGTYRIGFGQRLTFDTTNQYTPNGIYRDHEILRVNHLSRACRESAGELEVSPCAGDTGQRYEMPDFRWRSRLMGVAAGVKAMRLGDGLLQAYGFASRQPHGIYQYQIYDRRYCDDPRHDDPGCSAPHVFRRQADPLAPTSRFSFHTLPNLFTETLAGGNVAYRMSRRAHVGVTAYRSSVDWRVDEMDLDFQSWARLPHGGPFGAVGVDGGWGHEWLDVFLEATRSFDSMPGGGGGFAGLMRNVATWEGNEVEASLRYYETGFANPHARPISAPSLHEGLRARDELGGRLRYTGRIGRRLHLRSNLDIWRALSSERPSLLAFVRGDYRLARPVTVGLWTQFQDRDLEIGGRTQCFQSPFEADEEGEPVPCSGKRYQGTARLRFEPARRYYASLQVRHDLLDDGRYPDRFRRDLVTWLTLGARPHDALRLRARARYLFEDLSDDRYLERSVWAYLDAAWTFYERNSLRLRYDLYARLDRRESTLLRRPSPEQWVTLELEARF